MKTSLLLPVLTLLSPCSGFRWIVPGSDGGDHGESVETEGHMADLNKEGSCCEWHNFDRVTIIKTIITIRHIAQHPQWQCTLTIVM